MPSGGVLGYRKAVTKERAEVLRRIGLDPTQVDAWFGKWQNLKCSSKQRGSICLLTFEQYVSLAKETGLTEPQQIGKKSQLYQMARIGDTGNYELGNCRFVTMSQNAKERADNGGAAVSVHKAWITRKEKQRGTSKVRNEMLQ